MNASDFEVLVALITRSRNNALRLRALVEFTPGADDTSGELLADLAGLEADIADITSVVQDREARSWKADHKPRHPAPQHPHPPVRTGPPLSTEIAHGIHVQRYGVTGRAVSERASEPPERTGKWAQWRSSEKPTT